MFGVPLAVCRAVALLRTVADTVTPLLAYVLTVSRSRELSISGTITRFWTPALPTGSSHAGCQIPLEDVYMIPPG